MDPHTLTITLPPSSTRRRQLTLTLHIPALRLTKTTDTFQPPFPPTTALTLPACSPQTALHLTLHTALTSYTTVILASALKATPVVLNFPLQPLLLHAEPCVPELVTHVSHIRIGSRGLLNAPVCRRAFNPHIVLSRMRPDGSWAPFCRAAPRAEVAGSIVSYAPMDADSTAVRIDAFRVGKWREKLVGSAHFSLAYLMARRQGAMFSLKLRGVRTGYCAVRKCELGKVESRFVLDVFFYAAAATTDEMGLVMDDNASVSMEHVLRSRTESMMDGGRRRSGKVAGSSLLQRALPRAATLLKPFRTVSSAADEWKAAR